MSTKHRKNSDLMRGVEARVMRMSKKLNEHIQKNGSSAKLKKKSLSLLGGKKP